MSEFLPGTQPTTRMSSGRKTALLGLWMFPYLLAAGAYFGGHLHEPASVLRTPVLVWPVSQAVYGWLLLLVLLSAVWLVGEFFSVTSRETVVAALQWDAVVSALTAIIFTGWGGMVYWDRNVGMVVHCALGRSDHRCADGSVAQH